MKRDPYRPDHEYFSYTELKMVGIWACSDGYVRGVSVGKQSKAWNYLWVSFVEVAYPAEKGLLLGGREIKF
jgi:hypothetical protein